MRIRRKQKAYQVEQSPVELAAGMADMRRLRVLACKLHDMFCTDCLLKQGCAFDHAVGWDQFHNRLWVAKADEVVRVLLSTLK